MAVIIFFKGKVKENEAEILHLLELFSNPIMECTLWSTAFFSSIMSQKQQDLLGLGRLEYLQALVTEFQVTESSGEHVLLAPIYFFSGVKDALPSSVASFFISRAVFIILQKPRNKCWLI